ncbi:MAG: hypothetical protein ACE5FN_11605 [Leptospirillia bacterium]
MDYDLNYQEGGEVDADSVPNKIGDTVPETGTYECHTCGEEVEAKKDDKFPPCENCGDEYLTWVLLSNA